jgi:hypothetical protein
MGYRNPTVSKKDDNHNQIVNEFKILGWSVLEIYQLKNCCDIIIAKPCGEFLVTICIEIKDGKKAKSKRKLTEGEDNFKTLWRGYYEVIESIEGVHSVNKKYMGLVA